MGRAESDLKDAELTEPSRSTRNRARISAIVVVVATGDCLLYVWPIVGSGGGDKYLAGLFGLLQFVRRRSGTGLSSLGGQLGGPGAEELLKDWPKINSG